MSKYQPKNFFSPCLLKMGIKGYKIIYEKGSDMQKRLIKIYSVSKKFALP